VVLLLLLKYQIIGSGIQTTVGLLTIEHRRRIVLKLRSAGYNEYVPGPCTRLIGVAWYFNLSIMVSSMYPYCMTLPLEI
jgi:hypothetical protein